MPLCVSSTTGNAPDRVYYYCATTVLLLRFVCADTVPVYYYNTATVLTITITDTDLDITATVPTIRTATTAITIGTTL